MEKVAIGLGSNVGDRAAMIAQAAELLGEVMQKVEVSSLLETPALLKEGSPEEWNLPFLNAALIGETELSPQELLKVCQNIEKQLQREKIGLWSPRTIDLDILLYGEQLIDEPHLQVPHPLMLERNFVMIPLIEIAGEWVHPITKMRLSELGEEEGASSKSHWKVLMIFLVIATLQLIFSTHLDISIYTKVLGILAICVMMYAFGGAALIAALNWAYKFMKTRFKNK